jgi:hypothetical protein
MRNALLIVLIVTLAICAIMRIERFESIRWMDESLRYIATPNNTCEAVLASQGMSLNSYEQGHQQIINKLTSVIYQSADGNKFTTGECLVPSSIMQTYKVPETCIVDGVQLRVVKPSEKLSNGASITYDGTGCAVDPSDAKEFQDVMGYMYGVQTEGQTKLIGKQNNAITSQTSTNTTTQSSTNTLTSDTVSTQNNINNFKGDNWSLQVTNNGLEETSKYIARLNDGTVNKIGDLDQQIAAYRAMRTITYEPWVAPSTDNRWMTPSRGMSTPGNLITSMHSINIPDNNSKTFSFWLHIHSLNSWWRNVFHVTDGIDIRRRPALFIGPGTSYIHICHDTLSTVNNPFDIPVPYQQPVHIALTWHGRSCAVFLNGVYAGGTTYNNDLAPTSNFSLYIADRFYSEGGFTIKNFKIHKYAMTAADALKEFQGWRCGVAGYQAPMRINNNGNVECMSTNSRDCLWMGNTRDCVNQVSARAAHAATRSQIRPLECGEMHRQQWGGRGDDNPGHWCSIVKRSL